MALSQAQEEAAETITMPKPLSISRFIPTGEERTIGFVASLYPDCTSRGPIVARLIKAPAHGAMTFGNAISFPNYNATSAWRRATARRRRASTSTTNPKTDMSVRMERTSS